MLEVATCIYKQSNYIIIKHRVLANKKDVEFKKIIIIWIILRNIFFLCKMVDIDLNFIGIIIKKYMLKEFQLIQLQ